MYEAGPEIPLCDNCYIKTYNMDNPTMDDLCNDCRETFSRFCFCCQTVQDEKLDFGVCDECKKNDCSWIREAAHEIEEQNRASSESPTPDVPTDGAGP